MNENSKIRLPTGLIWLLIYQWTLVLGSLGCVLYTIVENLHDVVEYWPASIRWGKGVVASSFGLLVLTCWGTAMFFASVEMHRQSPRGFLLGMICHLLLAIPGVLGVLFFGFFYLRDTSGWAILMLICGLMCLPFALFNSWAFFYLRRLRKSLFP